jgi:UDP-N-acetylmuramyl pentapeptide phosphotransferase/UDP-N-acetylglucosamine-1-phosphate transferase
MAEWAESRVSGLLTPVLILGVPRFDIAFVGVARIVMGKVHTVGECVADVGQHHIHHRVEALGPTTRESVLLIHLAAASLGVGAVLEAVGRRRGT